MRNLCCILLLLLSGANASAFAASHDSMLVRADALARAAFYAVEADPFNRDVLRRALMDVQAAEKLDPLEPWVAVAASRIALELGYRKGDRSRLSSYSAESVAIAEQHAKRAVEIGPRLGIAYTQLARVQIILDQLKPAWMTPNRAYELDKSDFYPWYYRSVISLHMRDLPQATKYLKQAQMRAIERYQKSWVLGQRLDAARLQGDKVLVESLYRESIALNPESAHAYGNFGSFLLKLKRYDEAVENLEKAVSITPYPLANEELQRARLLQKSAHR